MLESLTFTGLRFPASLSFLKKATPGGRLVRVPPVAALAARTVASAVPEVRGSFMANVRLYSPVSRSCHDSGTDWTSFGLTRKVGTPAYTANQWPSGSLAQSGSFAQLAFLKGRAAPRFTATGPKARPASVA